jgi:hypothetical protein
MRRNGLSKYDAPLRIQFEWGQEAFKRGKVTCPIDSNTMQAREWHRGWNTAYHVNLQKVQRNEQARARS